MGVNQPIGVHPADRPALEAAARLGATGAEARCLRCWMMLDWGTCWERRDGGRIFIIAQASVHLCRGRGGKPTKWRHAEQVLYDTGER